MSACGGMCVSMRMRVQSYQMCDEVCLCLWSCVSACVCGICMRCISACGDVCQHVYACTVISDVCQHVYAEYV